MRPLLNSLTAHGRKAYRDMKNASMPRLIVVCNARAIVQTVERALRKRIGRFQYQDRRLVNALANRTSGRRVVFLHIPKCAGRSVNLLFKTYYGSGRSTRVVAINDRERGSRLPRESHACS